MAAAMDQRPQQSRTRSKSTFSFKSDRSHHSQPSRTSKQYEREHLKESPAEKRKTHLTETTKANPNAAMNEAQPIAAALEKPTLQSLRSFTHTDVNGNIITEPDLSNPTRPRWERPLDTIRSFEAAIDNEYKRRTIMKPDAPTDMMSGYASRRSSYYGGHDQNRYSRAGPMYGNRMSVARDGWENGHYGGGGPSRSHYPQRPQGDWNRYNNAQGIYPVQGYQQSRDTVDTGASSGSQSEPYSNDPSDNSSIERAPPVQPVQKQDLGEQYGFNGFGGGPQFQGPILQEFGNRNGGPVNGVGTYQQNQYVDSNRPPPVPTKAPIASNVNTIRLGGGQNENSPPAGSAPSEKRKSWFKRRFSKN